MKTKSILNSALSVLVALGVAACSSGGGSASADVKKSLNNVKQEVKKPVANTDTAEEAKQPSEVVKEYIQQPTEVAKEEVTQPVAETSKESVKQPMEQSEKEIEKLTEIDKEETKQPEEMPQMNDNNSGLQKVDYTYRIVTKDTDKLDVGIMDKFLKEKVNFSEMGELVIDGRPASSEILFVSSQNGESPKMIELINPKKHNWQYQTFGQFNFIENDLLGFVSVGNKTGMSQIPTAGTANYKGTVWGRSTVPEHRVMNGSVKADLVVDVDFATKEVKFKTENTKLNRRTAPVFDLTGSAKLDSSSGQFVDGKVHLTQAQDYSGKLEGALFGPKAEEVGGTFDIQEGRLIGGFGAKQ